MEEGNRNLGNWKSLKTLRVERFGLNFMGGISTSSGCGIGIAGPVPLSLGELGDFQCFGEFGASGRVRTIKIGERFRDLHKLTS